MTRDEMIEHWANLAAAVFKAEDAIKDEWLPKLQATKNASDIEKQQVADAYLIAIATEIIDNTKWEE